MSENTVALVRTGGQDCGGRPNGHALRRNVEFEVESVT